MKNTIIAISKFLKKHPVDYKKCLEELKGLNEIFPFLIKNTNHISAAPHDYTISQLKFIIEQYSVFSKGAIHMLLDAMVRNYNWTELFKELQENINEEKGSETKNVPHLEIMRRSYKNDLAIFTDDVVPCHVTCSFIEKMNKIFNNNDNAYSAGALLAFEGTAIQEFHIIDAIIKTYDKKRGANKIQSGKALTNLYIDGHKSFEIGHEARLVSAIEPYITESNIEKMVKGYLDVCLTMNVWWKGLEIESWYNLSKETLEVKNIEEFPIEKVLLNE